MFLSTGFIVGLRARRPLGPTAAGLSALAAWAIAWSAGGTLTRWDALHLLVIGRGGYPDPDELAFFPLYPLLARGSALGGTLVSLLALAAGLEGVRRLATLELGAAAGRRTVWLVAFFPTAFFFAAPYSESLFLALSVWSLYAARTGRWPLAASLGGLAALTRNSGVLLLVPLAALWLGARPRPPRRSALWLAAVPLGLGVYLFWCGLAHGDLLAPLHAQRHWGRSFHGPFSAVAYAFGDLAAGGPVRGFEPLAAKWALLACVVLAAGVLVLALRRLPLAYGAYALVALALPLSSPWPAHPLMSLPRYLAVLFPLHMALAAWCRDHRRFAFVITTFAAGFAFLCAHFAAGHLVA